MALFFRAERRMFFLILLGWPSDEKNHAAFVRDLREFSRAGECVVDRVGGVARAGLALEAACFRGSRSRVAAGARAPCDGGRPGGGARPHRWIAQRFDLPGEADIHNGHAARRA